MTIRSTLKATGFEVFPLCLGGNVFGWSASESESFHVLDAFYEAGGNFIDTADMYSEWKVGNVGGESETIIGKWVKSRGVRNDVVIATKVAKLSTRKGLAPSNIKAAIEDSLRRLQTDYVDLYYAHEDDQSVQQEDVLSAFHSLMLEGKVRALGASNFTGERLRSAAKIAADNSLSPFKAIQNQYNLLDRFEFESDAKIAAEELGLDSFPFYGVARGFLSGKYQPGVHVDSVRAGGVTAYTNDRGWKVLAQVEELSKNHGASMTAIALAWLRAKGQLPIASARTVDQLRQLMEIVNLDSAEMASLDKASAQ